MESPHNSQKQVFVCICVVIENVTYIYIYIYTVEDKIISPPQFNFNTFSNIS